MKRPPGTAAATWGVYQFRFKPQPRRSIRWSGLARRVTHSLLDPLLAPLVPGLYRAVRIPKWFPPEGIVILGHLVAAAGAVGIALAPRFWWAGLLAAFGAAGNHLCDLIDGTHARATGQCRNGGELLDHFFDPLSFSYWMVGLGIAAERLDLALVCVLWIYATAVLTNIRAKITGEFVLARVGPTEFKALIAILGLALAGVWAIDFMAPTELAAWSLWAFAALGVLQLVVNLVLAVIAVNRSGVEADSSDWSRPPRS